MASEDIASMDIYFQPRDGRNRAYWCGQSWIAGLSLSLAGWPELRQFTFLSLCSLEDNNSIYLIGCCVK